MTSSLDVVIVSFNTRDDLLACLASLMEHPPSAPFRVRVVDNASTDGSAEAVRARYPDVRVDALERNVGFAAANNIALRQGAAALVLLLNNDTLVTRGAIDTLIARLERIGATAVGPRLIDAAGLPEISYGRMLSPLSELAQIVRQRAARSSNPLLRGYAKRLVSRERDVDWVSGACVLVRRDAAVAAGLFDERYFLYEEDVDFCAALRAHGGRIVYTPQAEIVHRRGRSQAPGGPARATHYDRSHLAFYAKHAPGWVPLLRLWLRMRGRDPDRRT